MGTTAVLIGGFPRNNSSYVAKLKGLGVDITHNVTSMGRRSPKTTSTKGADVILFMWDVANTPLKNLAERTAKKKSLPLVYVSKSMTATRKALSEAGIGNIPRRQSTQWGPDRIQKIISMRAAGKTYDQIAIALSPSPDGLPVSGKAVAAAHRRHRETEQVIAREKEEADTLVFTEEITELQGKVKTAQKELADARDYSRALEEEAEAKAANMQKEIAAHKEAARLANAGRDQLLESGRAAEEEVYDLRKQLEALQTSESPLAGHLTVVEGLRKQLQERDVSILSLREEITEHRRAVRVQRADIAARDESCRGLKSENERLKTSRTSDEMALSAEVQRLNAEVKRLEQASSNGAGHIEGDEFQRGVKAGLSKGIKVAHSPETMELLELLGVL